MEKLKSIYIREQFQPRLIGLFVNPFYISRRALYKYTKILGREINGKVLDVGCGTKPYKNLFNTKLYVGIDLYKKSKKMCNYADTLYDGKNAPFSDEAFDSILCNQVLEHVYDYDQFFKELNRLLKTDGMLLLSVPFIWDEHEQPNDYRRFTSFGIISEMKLYGFDVLTSIKTLSDASLIFQIINLYITKIINSKNKYVNIVLSILLTSPFNILGILLSKVLPKNKDLYLDNIVLAKKKVSLKD